MLNTKHNEALTMILSCLRGTTQFIIYYPIVYNMRARN